VFELSFTKILVLLVVALLIFGPDQLPRVTRQAGQALRDLRKIAESAKADLQEGLGPEFRDFDINDLHPKTFVRKHLWDEFDNGTNGGANGGNGNTRSRSAQADVAPMLDPGESPPYDSEAT
jgi:sec-independent protein translocase protein TatB